MTEQEEQKLFPGTALLHNCPKEYERLLHCLLHLHMSADRWNGTSHRTDWFWYLVDMGALPCPTQETLDHQLPPGCTVDDAGYIYVSDLEALYRFWERNGMMTREAERMFVAATLALAEGSP